MRTLYICYLGLLEPLVQTQVLPYLRQLRQGDIKVSLLTFEPDQRRIWTAERVIEWKTRLARDGIIWYSLPYHKRPTLPATLFDIAAGTWTVCHLVRQQHIGVLHGRTQIGAAIGALAKKLVGGKLVFDIRGFMAEEYVDGGLWPRDGFLFRCTKAVERWLMAASDGFVVLTERAREILFPGCSDTDALSRPIEVIPCCVDMARFRPLETLDRRAIRAELGLSNRKVIIYIGALGTWYLADQMAQLAVVAKERNPLSFFLVLTQNDPEIIRTPLRNAGLENQDYLIRKVTPEEIPRYLAAADSALSFIKPCYSKQSSSPTKIAEYLASGLPVISTAGIGDTDQVLQGERVGVLVRDMTPSGYHQALDKLDALQQDTGLASRCKDTARKHFDLDTVGGPRYRRLYQRLEAHHGSKNTAD